LLNEAQTENIDIVTSPYNMFKYSIRTELTRKYYERRIRTFFDFIGFMVGSVIEERCNSFSEECKSHNEWALTGIIKFLQYEKERVQREEITAATLINFVKSIKLFCEMCDISIPWKKITRGLPRPRGVANDRAPSIDEIRQLVQYPDRRIKPIIYTMASSGIRLGAWDYLKWKHIIPLHSKSGSIIFLQELAVVNIHEVSSICLVLLILVSEIIPVSIKCNKAVCSITLIFSILNNIDNCSNEHSYYSYDKWIIILVFLYKIARFNSPSLQSVCKSCRHLPAIIWLPGLRVCD